MALHDFGQLLREYLSRTRNIATSGKYDKSFNIVATQAGHRPRRRGGVSFSADPQMAKRMHYYAETTAEADCLAAR